MQPIVRFMRFFFYHFYHSFAWTYDFVAAVVSVGRWNGWVESSLAYVQGPRILEIGHGPGFLLGKLRDKYNLVIGLDESVQMGQLAKRRLKRAGMGQVNLTRALAQELPFYTGSFDSVVSTFPSEYIYDPKTVSGIYYVLKAHGRFVLLPAAWIVGSRYLDRAAAWLFRITGEAPREVSSIIGQRTLAPLERAGFQVEIKQIEMNHSMVVFLVATK